MHFLALCIAVYIDFYRLLSTTIQDRSPTGGPWTYRCLICQPQSPVSPTSVSRRQLLRAYVPGRVIHTYLPTLTRPYFRFTIRLQSTWSYFGRSLRNSDQGTFLFRVSPLPQATLLLKRSSKKQKVPRSSEVCMRKPSEKSRRYWMRFEQANGMLR